MASRSKTIQECEQISVNTAAQITSSYQEWTGFLTTAARLYKYPFPEQLMIYAQRPDATACAGYDVWNKTMRRYIRRGAKGIALIDTSRGRPVIRYVFDVSDTGRMENSRNPNLWQYREEHRDVVTAALESRFGVAGGGDLAGQLEQIASQLAAEYWNDNKYDITHIVDGSFLEGYDEFNIGSAFRSAAATSITYALMSRCGLEPEDHFEHEDFLSIFDFNTQATVTALGMAVSQSSERVLRQIEAAVKRYEREKERSAQYGERSELQPARGLPAPQPETERTADAGPGQVREDAPAVSEGTPPGPVGESERQRDTVPAPAGDRGRGEQQAGADDAGTGESGGRDGGTESQRSDEMGGADEHLQGAGGGSYFVGTDSQLSFIPTQQQQIAAIQGAESVKTPSAPAFSQEDIDAELRRGSGVSGGKLRVYQIYTEVISPKDAIKALKKEYGTCGHGHTFLDGTTGFVDYRPDKGMILRRNDPKSESTLSWAKVEKRIRQLIEDGVYLTPEEVAKYESAHQETPAPVPEDKAPETRKKQITDADLDKLLIEDWGIEDRKQLIYGLFQEGRNDTEIVPLLRKEFLSREYRRGGLQTAGFCELADGSKGYAYYVAAELRITPRPGGEMRTVSYEEIARRIRALIGEGRYLSPDELARYEEEHAAQPPEAEVPAPSYEAPVHVPGAAIPIPADLSGEEIQAAEPAPEAEAPASEPSAASASHALFDEYVSVKQAHPDDIVLYQVGDFYEMFGADAENAAPMLGLTLTTRPVGGLGRVSMCGIPVQAMDSYVERLRARYDVTISGVTRQTGERTTLSFLSIEHEARRAAEAVPVPPPAAKPEAEDPAPPTPREATQADIDAALQGWNGDIASKHTVIRYMEKHAREKDTAAWLQKEYGGDLPSFPVQLPGTDQYHYLPWPKVQRRIAQLIQKDQFYTQEERDNFDDIDPVAVRERLESGESSRFVEQVMADVERLAGQDEQEPLFYVTETSDAFPDIEDSFAIWDRAAGTYYYAPDGRMPTFRTEEEAQKYLHASLSGQETSGPDRSTPEALGPNPTVREIFEHYKSVVKNMVLADEAYQNACRNSDHQEAMTEGKAAVNRAVLTIQDPNFQKLYYDLGNFHTSLEREVIDETYPVLSAAAPDLSGKPITREGDTLTVGSGTPTHEIDITVTDEQWQQLQEAVPEAAEPDRDPLAPAYAVGDTVYLEDTAYQITDISPSGVQLLDPTLPYPIFRAESKDRFAILLQRDHRNGPITEFLSADLERYDQDLRDVLTSGLLTVRDKDYICQWLRNGEGNTQIAHRLSEMFAGRAETMELETGEKADYFTSTTGIEVNILDDQDYKKATLAAQWGEIAPVLRALFQQELHGFAHEPVQREPVHLEGQPAYQVGDHVNIPGHDHEISGTVEHIGEHEVLVHTGPYAWSQEMVSREQFEEGLRQDERNADLFIPEDKIPAHENFRITDDHLGEGGPKVKYQMNIEAICTLKQIEAEGRDATKAEQEVLSRYVGWGGIPDAFDPDKASWAAEYRELKKLLTEEEYASARASTLNAHYTSPTVIKAIYEAIGNMGFTSGNILEESVT